MFSDRKGGITLPENSYFMIPIQDTTPDLLELIRGKLFHLYRGTPVERRIRIGTTYATIRGTEYAIEYDDSGVIRVKLFNGAIALRNPFGILELKNQQEAVIRPNTIPEKTEQPVSIRSVPWCMFYPSVLSLEDLWESSPKPLRLAKTLEAYREGDIVRALSRYQESGLPTSSTMEERLLHAQLLLGVGATEKAGALLEPVLAMTPRTSRVGRLATALTEIIEIILSDTAMPMDTGRPAPLYATEWLVESFRLQAAFELENARAAVSRSLSLKPHWGIAWERLAQVEFSLGNVKHADHAIERALEFSPKSSQAWTLRGFVLASKNQWAESLHSFQTAIELDGSYGAAWLGRGLNRLRTGLLMEALDDLQMAATFEPQRGIYRGYLGKALVESGNPSAGERELTLAMGMRPQDPTIPLYKALLKQQQNEVNKAVELLESSLALNDNRRLFRSRFLLDQDRAVRGSSLATVYQRAGLERASLAEGARSVSADYSSWSSHRFLAESYDRLRDPTRFNLRHETTWFNELLLANLLSPVGGGLLSQSVTSDEYSRFFESTRPSTLSVTDYRSDGQMRETVAHYGTIDRLSWAVDLDYFHRRGYQPGSDLNRLEWYTTLKQQISHQDNVLLLTKVQDFESGDHSPYYDPSLARQEIHFKEEQSPIALAGYHREWGPGVHTLILGGRIENAQTLKAEEMERKILFRDSDMHVLGAARTAFDLDYASELEIYTGEICQILEGDSHRLEIGGRGQAGDFLSHSTLIKPRASASSFENPAANTTAEDDFDRLTAYGYYTAKLPTQLHLTGGLAYDQLLFPQNLRSPPVQTGTDVRKQFGPKAGLIWSPQSSFTIRAVYSESLGGVSLDESYRLERAQLAGFPQALRTVTPEVVANSVAAPEFQVVGAACDFKLPGRWFLGLETTRLRAETTQMEGVFDYIGFEDPIIAGSTPLYSEGQEQVFATYVYKLLGEEWSIGAEYAYTLADFAEAYSEIPREFPASHQESARRHHLHPFVSLNRKSGVFARMDGHYVSGNTDLHSGIEAEDSLGQWDVRIGYRFPRQQGDLSLGLLNITDADYRLGPLIAAGDYPRSRSLNLRIRLRF